MKHVIIGTAGHIDHGKTTLIKALTGRETDRLKEEKERGISIELGFTYFDLPSGKRAGIIDVPGHERFIKNMLAGASGIDVVVLVIAADEGVMPQTKEHLNILSLLNVGKGIVALTKKDAVDSEWLEMMTEQVREELSGTFLSDASIIPVSSLTREGIDELVAKIDSLTEVVEPKDKETIFRLPVDRVFSISGFGTIVTGTLISGTINEGDKIMIFPSGIESRVRSIQVHEKSTKSAYAGQRVAINIANVKVDQIKRGDVIAPINSLKSSMMIDARFELLPDSERSIDNRDRLRLYHETSEIMCRVVLLDREELKPGESAFVQFRLEEEIACQKGDRFVIRFYSPMITIGGGTVLEPNAPKRKRFKEDVIEELKIKEQGDPLDIVLQYIEKLSPEYPDKKTITKAVGNINEERLNDILKGLESSESIVQFEAGIETYILHTTFLKELEDDIVGLLSVYHNRNPLKAGMSKEELKKKTMEKAKSKLSDAIFMYFVNKGIIKINAHFVALVHFKIEFNKEQQNIRDIILNSFRENRFNPPKLADIINNNKLNTVETEKVFSTLIDNDILVKVAEDIVFDKNAYDESVELLRSFIKTNKSIQLGQFRDLLQTSRKFAMALLDYFDQVKITKRVEDKRILF